MGLQKFFEQLRSTDFEAENADVTATMTLPSYETSSDAPDDAGLYLITSEDRIGYKEV